MLACHCPFICKRKLPFFTSHTHKHHPHLTTSGHTFIVITIIFCMSLSLSSYPISQSSMNILRIICALASILFVMSDTMIAINKFYAPISNSSVGVNVTINNSTQSHLVGLMNFLFRFPQFWIMTTYYAAQFGFSLSIMDMESKIKQK